MSGFKLFLKVSLKSFKILLKISIIFIGKNLLSIFFRQLNYKAIFRFLLFLLILRAKLYKSPHFGNAIFYIAYLTVTLNYARISSKLKGNIMKKIDFDSIEKELRNNSNHSWFEEIYNRNKNNLDAIALTYRGKKITYGEMFKNMILYAKMLEENGVGKGDEVPLSIPNTPEFVYLLGAISIRSAEANIFCQEFEDDYLDEIINGCNSNLLFVSEMSFVDLEPVLKNTNKKIIYVPLENSLKSGNPYTPITERFYKSDNDKIQKIMDELDNVSMIDENLESDAEIDINDVLISSTIDTIFTTTYSSGSTNSSRPKGIVHANRSYIFMGRYHDPEVSGIPAMKNNTTLALIPTHSNTNFMSSISDTLMEGGTVALEPIYDKDFFLYSLSINKPRMAIATRSFWINAMKQSMRDPAAKNIKLKSLFVPIAVGEPLVKNEEKALNKWLKKMRAGIEVIPSPTSFVKMSVAGGDCEHGGIFLVLYRALQSKKPEYLFQEEPHGMTPFSMVDVKILDEKGNYCRPYQMGTIVANSPCNMVGYKNNSEATENFYVSDIYGKKWATCSAYGYLDNFGNVYMKGRVLDKFETLPTFMVADQILKDTKNVLSCEVVKVVTEDGEKYVAHIEPICDKPVNVNKLLESAYHRCVAKFGVDFCANIYFNFRSNEISFPLTGCGKRSANALIAEGVPKDSVNFKMSFDSDVKKLVK